MVVRSKSTKDTKKKPVQEAKYESVYQPSSTIDHDGKTETVEETAESPKPLPQRSKTDPNATVKRSARSSRPVMRKSTTSSKTADKTGMSTVSKASTIAKSTKTSILVSLFAKPAPTAEKQVSCLTCGSDDVPISRSARLPCTHRMCHSCLKRIFKLSLRDPAHMPPRCCTQDDIALKHVDKLFKDDFKNEWNRKYKEYKAKNRIYCPRRGCGEWIQPKHIKIEGGRKVGVCAKCHQRVCTVCNLKAHKSRECPKDPTVREFNEMVKEQGWVKCYNCSATVELKEGCNHMTCRCTAEFCMVCGKKWKSCDCPWFNYEALGNLGGDPIRYQQELDRRREQERQDEELARAMAGGDNPRRRRDRHAPRDFVEVIEMNDQNQNFIQQAREALTANYQTGEHAARGLLGGWLTGARNVHVPDDVRPGQEDPVPIRRRVHRVRHAD